MRTASKHSIRAALSGWNWGAVLAGVVVALATQILGLWLGNAFARSVGDELPEGGFAVWAVFVQLGSLFLGAGFAAYLSRTTFTGAGAAVGAFTWAVALVLGSALASHPLAGWRPEDAAAAAWTTFLGGLLSLATAMLGGAIGSRLGRRELEEPRELGEPREPEHVTTVTRSPFAP